jgi:hypothetical protein
VNVWSFVTLVLAALAVGAPLAHALEMPVRRAYAPDLYVTVTHTLYFYFGTVGAAIELGALFSALVWIVLLVRSAVASRPARRWALAGAACLLLAHGLFWLLVNPANRQFALWTPSSVPADWTRWRDQWEFTHTARAGLFLLGFCGLLGSVYAFRSRAGWPAGHPDPRRGGTTG